MLPLSSKYSAQIVWWEDTERMAFLSSHLVHWLNIIPYPLETSQESIDLERKYSLESSSVMTETRRESGRETYWL